MMVIRFRSKEDHSDLLHKVKKMQEFTDELEDSFDFAPVIKAQQAPQFDMMSGGMGFGGMMQDIVINLTAEIDGMVLARKMYRYNQDEALRLGTGLVEA